ncbi:hypothetical protein A3F66_00895 [candidate division TM6 bacterium RIFCSPHIGHO2_12_FULL_32_22]|nr:MAG: hypothetical protein A3F66_00895 [candidate division TM6 bacterium RIFCSPHIGHO2_12_FULL_32_22]
MKQIRSLILIFILTLSLPILPRWCSCKCRYNNNIGYNVWMGDTSLSAMIEGCSGMCPFPYAAWDGRTEGWGIVTNGICPVL